MKAKELLSELFIPQFDSNTSVPAYIALYRVLERNIIDGKLSVGAKLPASRPLSISLKVSRNTVKAAYELLQAEGYIETKRGAGSYVSKVLVNNSKGSSNNSEPQNQAENVKLSRLFERLTAKETITPAQELGLLAPAIPAISEFPWIQWQRSVNYAGRVMKHEVESSALGSEQLRVQIASYLKIVRGVDCHKENIMIFSGSQQAIYMSLQLLINPGDSVFVENPCYFGIDGAVNALNATKIPIEIDHQGFNLKREFYQNSKVAVVTPSRNYPLGHTMSLNRRLALLNWAKEHNSWIIEDDYDSEFRFDGPPLTCLQGLGKANRVIYAGTFSRILHPSIRIGYLVLPEVLVEPFSLAKKLMHGNVPILPQLALAEFMSTGYFSSHVRKMRKLYRGRRDFLRAIIQEQLEGYLSLVESDGGMHCVYILNKNVSDIVVCNQARKQGLGVMALSPYYSGDNKRNGLVIGFAGYNESEQLRAVGLLAKIMRNANLNL